MNMHMSANDWIAEATYEATENGDLEWNDNAVRDLIWDWLGHHTGLANRIYLEEGQDWSEDLAEHLSTAYGLIEAHRKLIDR